MTRIARLFETLKREHRCGMIAYLTAGGPSPEGTPSFIPALERGGADLIELGVPFSDPIADGPVIQQAGDRALAAGTTLAKVLDIAAQVRRRSEIPLLLFTDASVEEAGEYVKVMREAGLDTVFLAAPTSTERRLKLVAEYSSGFVYLVSRTGITGERQNIADTALPLIERMRAHTPLPLAMGFGVSKPEHVAALAGYVEAVVVGSAIVRQIERDPTKLEVFMRELTRPLASAKPHAALL